MNDTILRIQVTIEQMGKILQGLEANARELPKNPRLFACMSEAPLELLARMRNELEEHLAVLKYSEIQPESQLEQVTHDSETARVK